MGLGSVLLGMCLTDSSASSKLQSHSHPGLRGVPVSASLARGLLRHEEGSSMGACLIEDKSLSCCCCSPVHFVLQIQQAGWHVAPDWSLAKALASDELIADWQQSPLIQDPNSLDLAAAVMEGPCIPILVGVEVGLQLGRG